jgi:hypothetical protein
MEMAVRSIETVETVMETDGDGSGGTSPSRQGARIETFVPRNLSSMAVELWNCSGKNADCFRVFRWEDSYRRRAIVRGGPEWPHHGWAQLGAGSCPLWCGQPLAPLRLPFGPRPSSRKNRSFRTCFVQFREYFLCSFTKTQK